MIDPMHNLLLASAKTFTKLWIQEAQPSCDYVRIQKAVDAFVTPAGIGRLPRKVESGFSNFKAEQWKNWILLYSTVCFKQVLSDAQYSMWLVFVEACSLLCSRAISKNAISRADLLIHHYCCLFEAEFGKGYCYPNLHMHCHLKQCLLDFGPATSFWLFAFERINGVLGSFHTNNQAVEVQLFRKFISKQQVSCAEWPDIELTHALKPVIANLEVTKDTTHCGGLFIHIISPFERAAILEANNSSKLLPPVKEKGFLSNDISLINTCFSTYFGEEYVRTLILHTESKSIIFNGDLYGTFFSRQKNSSLIVICKQDGNGVMQKCICAIVGFVKCTVILNSTSAAQDFILAEVVALQEHHQKNYYPQPVQVFKIPDSVHLSDRSRFCYVLLSCILCRCAYTVFVNDSSAIAVVPCNSYCGLF